VPQKSGNFLFGARKAEYGVKQAAPANYRTQCFVQRFPVLSFSIRSTGDLPIARRNVPGSRLFNKICGHPRGKTKMAGF
jgi:hypothetical protein